MALLTTSSQQIATGTSSNNSFTFTHKLFAWISNIREGYVTVNVEYKVSLSSSQYTSYSGTWGNGGGCYSWDPINSTQTRRAAFSANWSTNTDYTIFSYSFDVDARSNTGWSGNVAVWTDYSWAGSSYSTRAETTAEAFAKPYGTGGNNVRPGIETVKANIYVSSWGGGGSTDDRRYREFSVWQYSTGISGGVRRYQKAYGKDVTSGDIEVTNSSEVAGGMSIVGNTRYKISAYSATYSSAFSSTWQGSGQKDMGTTVTLPYAATLSLNTANSNSLDINYSTPASGGYYAQTIEYSIDEGTTWTTGATVSGASASSGVFTISNLNANTQYTIQSRVKTTAGTTTNTSITASTIGPTAPTLTVANNGSNFRIQTATYGTTSFGGGSEPIVCLYRGISANPTTLVDSKSTTGTSTFDNTNLAGNTMYYYRAKAGAIFGSGKNYFVIPTSVSSRVNDNALTVTRTSPGTNSTSLQTIVVNLAPNTTYTLSYNKTITGDVLNRTGEVRLRKDGTWTNIWDSTGTLTFTTGPTGEMSFGFYNYFSDNVGGTNTVAWSNIQVEKGSSKTSFVSHNVDYVWSDYVTKNLATRPPQLTISSASTLQYDTASTVTARVQISVPADGGYSAEKKIQYRYSTDGGSTFTAWVDGPVISTSSATTTYVDYTGLPVSTTFRFSVRQVAITGGLTSNTTTKDYTSPGQHQPPTNFDFEIFDANTNLVNWLSTFSGYTSPIYVQGQSMVRMRIPEATKGTCSDGATLTKYTGKLVVDNLTINDTTFSYPVVIPFGFNKPTNRTTDYPSNLITIQGFVYDSLSTYTRVNKSALSLSWEKPTVAVSGERLPTIGTARIDYSGTYARLQDASLNSGNDLNSITVQYRILDTEGNVLKTWTTVSAPSSSINTNKPFLRDYSGRITVSNIPASSDCKVEVKITDHFTSVTSSYILTVWDNAQINEPVHCDIELWDWKTNTFIADLSYLVVGELNITWQLNDVEEVSFDMDLMEFEKKCQEMGLDSEDLLKPYAHDIRIRRNGEYIVGCQLVDVDIQISNNPPSKISVKGTGFLNLLKDQYILNEAWSGYTYAQIARKLVQAAQLPDCLVKNPTGDIDTSYWLSGHGTIAYSNSAHSGDGCISCSRSGTGWVSGGTQMDVDTGQTIKVDMWVKGQSGIDCYVRERRYVTESSTQGTIATITLNGSWQHIQVNSYTTAFENSYILVECNRTNSTNLLIDDCYVYAVNDDAALCNMNIPLGVDTASANQESSRQVNYELQNVKDALINLTNMEDDNFEFEFEPDRTFNVYSRKGADKLDLEVVYPGNVDSMIISRSASNVANKIIAMGSGIGDERLQTIVYNNTSRSSIGTRESVTTDSNISLEETLRSKAIGNLYDRKDPTNIPKIVIRDGSINPSNVETGDVVLVEVHGENFIESTTGEYRIVKIDYSLSENAVEKMTLTVERPIQRPAKKMIRYIRDSIAGNSVNGSNHWVEIKALMLVGNEYVDIARGKTVTISFTPSPSPHDDPQIVVDGNTTTEQNYLGQPANNTIGAVTVDLGSEYPVDYIQVWHYWQDGRSYKNNTLSVGTALVGGTTGTGALSDVLWQYSGTAYVESSQGKRSKWLQEQNVVEG